VTVPPLVAAKLALYEAMLDQDVGIADLAARPGRSESEVRRLLDLDHRSDIW
jgi:antitoxin HicB